MTSDDALLGAITALRGDMTGQFKGVFDRLDVIDGRVGELEKDRIVGVAVAATKAAMLANQRHEDQDRAARSEARTLTSLQWRGLWIAAAAGIGVPFMAAMLDLGGHILGGWR